MTEREKQLYQMLNTLYVVVSGYQNMPGETVHPMTQTTLEQAKKVLEKDEN